MSRLEIDLQSGTMGIITNLILNYIHDVVINTCFILKLLLLLDRLYAFYISDALKYFYLIFRRFKEDVQEVKRKPFCQLVSRIPSMTRKYTDGNGDFHDILIFF